VTISLADGSNKMLAMIGRRAVFSWDASFGLRARAKNCGK
jgi:hypothetical protein